MKSIVVIGVYFGEFPSNFNLWLNSCKYNPTIDFKIFTNQNIKSHFNNLEFINMTMDEFNLLIKKKIGKYYRVTRPYKCCDFKPVYGIILEDYIKGYDFWGYCDFDLIFGDIRKFITNDLLNKYDKILPLGHLSIFRNIKEVNERYKKDGSKCGNYDEVFSTDKSFAFDENSGINQIYLKNEYPLYDKRVFADISIIHKRFTLAQKDKNYRHQVFYWEKGHVYRAFLKKRQVFTDEFIYIHFKQRKYLRQKFNQICDSFYISNNGFEEKKLGIPSKNEIMNNNKYPGLLWEKIELFKYEINLLKNKIKKCINKLK